MKLNAPLFYLLLLFPSLLFSQKKTAELTGFYSDGMSQFSRTDLQLNEDGSFRIKRPLLDVDAYMERSESTGRWTSTGNKIILNPHLKPRKQEIWMEEKVIPGQDSISIQVHYNRKLYENEQLVEEGPYPFKRMTIYVNKRQKRYNLLRQYEQRICGHAPWIKNQTIVDSTNTFFLPKTTINKLGVMTYGFTEYKELPVRNSDTNHFDIYIVQPIDKERMPRSKEVIIKGQKAFYYEHNGKVITSGLLCTPLIRRR
ncbi:MAG: hypothetical protein AAGG75_24400 [Bacteroidota bacterium]